MSFLHPWAIGVGLIALGAPLAIHLLTRPRAVRMPLSTIRFVAEIVQARSRLSRMKEWLVLLLRMLAVALLALAIARPLWQARGAAEPAADSTLARVVILDVSQSMAAQSLGVQAFERARSAAAEYLKPRRQLSANLILAGARPVGVFDRPVPNLSTLQDELARAAVKPQRLDAQAAIDAAIEALLRHAGAASTRELIVISDFQRANWASVDFATVPSEIKVELRAVGSQQEVPNLGLLAVRCPGRAEQQIESRLELDVGNFSTVPRKVVAELRLAATSVQFAGLCAPGATTTLTAKWTPPQAGWYQGAAALLDADDALAADNSCAFSVMVHAPPTYMLLTRQPADQIPSASYYLERALAPSQSSPSAAAPRVVRVMPAQADRERLAGADLIVLDHPGKLRDETIQTLVAMLRRGRGVLYVAAESPDAENFAALAATAGRDWQSPVEFVAPPIGRPRRGLFLVNVRQNRPPFRTFGDDALSAISPLRFSGGLDTRLRPNAVRDDILATFGDQSVFLTMTACGAGNLAVLNADLGSTNLTAEPTFVPLVGELVKQLLGRGSQGPPASCGEPTAQYLPPEVTADDALEVVRPADSAAVSTFAVENVGVLWQMLEPDLPGVYEVRQQRRPVFVLAVNVPRQESDLAVLKPDALTGRLSAGREIRYVAPGAEPDPVDRSWAWLAGAALCCLMLELVALRISRT